MENNLNSQSSHQAKREVSDVVFRELSDYFFEKIVFVNLAYSDLGSGGTTSTTDYGKLSRIIDTARGMLMSPGRESRLRCQFYLKNPSTMDGYILSPVVYDSQTLPASLTDMGIFRSYVGLKFFKDTVSVVVKEANKKEKKYPIDLTLSMFDGTYTDTYALEIRHNINSTDIIINNKIYGSYTSDLVGSVSTVETFYSFFSPARSTDGTSVNIVSENIQFIQNRQ